MAVSNFLGLGNTAAYCSPAPSKNNRETSLQFLSCTYTNYMYHLNNLLQAARISKRSILNITLEALKLRLFTPYIDISEYLNLRLYLDDLNFTQKTAFCGHRMQSKLIEILADEYSKFLAIDKITMYFLFRGSGFPTPDIRAVYRSHRPSALLNISTPQALEDYLRKPGFLPIYFKRSSGSYGYGNTLVSHISDDQLCFGSGCSQPISDFCASLDDGGTLGWILQKTLTAHSAIAQLCGTDQISSVRVHTILSASGSQIIRAIFKINVGNLDCDNFEHGASGNMLAAIDIETGKITRVISGIGLNQIENLLHPKTGKKIVGFEIPYWSKIVELVKDVHLAFPGFLCPGWDIAVCEDGPTILELNYFGDVDLSQQAYRLGFLDVEFLSFLKVRGLDKILHMKKKERQKIFDSSIASIKGHVGIKRGPWQW